MARATGSASTAATRTTDDGTKVIAQNPALKPASKAEVGPIDEEGRFTGKGVAGLKWERRWTTPGVHPYDEVTWELRSAEIKNESGKTVFEQTDIEVPSFWSQLATNVVVSKYFRGHVGTPGRERSVKQLIDRVVNTIAGWAATQHYFATDEDLHAFKAELTHLLLHQKMAFNSPVWFNVGVEEKPQCSACQPYRALVSTPDGMVPIGQLVDQGAVGREVYDANGITRIVAVKNNGFKPVWRIRLRNGNFVEATPDHVVKAVRDRRTQPEWLRVDELEAGMRMHLHPHRAKVNQVAMVAQRALVAVGSAGTGLLSDEPTDGAEAHAIAVAEAALAGWLQADGFVGQYRTGTNGSLTIEFQVANDDEYDWVMRNLDVAMPFMHVTVRDAATKSTRVQRIRLYGEQLRDFIERWELLKRGTDIRVPSRLWTASYDEICAYLRSIFQADGYVSVRRQANGQEAARVAFAVIGEKWTEDVQLLLNSVGIYSRRLHKREKREDRHDLYEIQVAVGSERALFAELVGFVGRDKQAKLLESLQLRGLKNVPNVREEEIVAIEQLGVEEVYDIQTESGEYLSNNVSVHNCFINSVEDDMSSIMDLAKTEAMLFKYGSGSGVNLSTLRGAKERLSKGGVASGPVSFMRGLDAFAGAIKSGGTTRRAAKMVVLNADHPDVMEFIDSKANEEKKAWALIEQGYDPSFTGEAYGSVMFQNANHSVRVTDDFMKAVEQDVDWATREVTTGEPAATYRARDLFERMADAAWICGDPGIQYDTIINDWNPVSNSARQNATNPCSEFSFIDSSSCNLASLNLMKFVRDDGEFDIDGYRYANRVTITAQDIIVDNASYPTPKIESNSYRFRPLGIGYTNLGALLMSRGLAYDSDEGRTYAAAITAIMTGETYRQSAEIARDHGGPFAEYTKNEAPFLRVINKHRQAAYEIDERLAPAELVGAARETWDEALELGTQFGYRNAQVSLLAPTGTISFMLDSDTTGIEPDIALIKYKKLVGEGFLKIVNKTVPAALRKLGYSPAEVEEIVKYIDERETIEGAPALKPEHLPVFDCAFKPVNGERSIHYMGHVRMMGATQPFLSGAISKTVNMPEAATAEDIADVYMEGWKLGLKAIAIYRDGSKRSQPLSTGKKKDKTQDAPLQVSAAAAPMEAGLAGEPKPYRRRLPDERRAITHKFQVSGHEGYITVGLYPDGQPGEIFLKMAKEGSTVSGLMDSMATMTSIALQYGVPLRDLVNKFGHVRFEPAGFTGNAEIPIAKSIVDYVFRWLGSRFLGKDERDALGIISRDDVGALPESPQGGSASSASGFAALTASAPERDPGAPELRGVSALAMNLSPTTESSSQGISGEGGKPDDSPKADALGQSTDIGTGKSIGEVGGPKSSAVTADPPPAETAGGTDLPVLSNGNGNWHTTDSKPIKPLDLGGGTKVAFSVSADSPSCADCGSIMVRNGSCYKCLNCGSTSGCS